jgi:hypothetical protein
VIRRWTVGQPFTFPLNRKSSYEVESKGPRVSGSCRGTARAAIARFGRATQRAPHFWWGTEFGTSAKREREEKSALGWQFLSRALTSYFRAMLLGSCERREGSARGGGAMRGPRVCDPVGAAPATIVVAGDAGVQKVTQNHH